MKHTLLFIYTLLFISFSGLGQKQVTNFDGKYLSNEVVTPLGQVEDYYIVSSSSSLIARINLKTLKMEKVVDLERHESPKILVTNNQLFVATLISNEKRLIINELDIFSGNTRRQIVIPDTYYVTSATAGFLIISGDNRKLSKIEFDNTGHHFKELLSRVTDTAVVENSFFSSEKEDKTIIHGFVDKKGNFRETIYMGSPSKGIEFSDFYVFLPVYQLNSAFILDKRTGKSRRFSNLEKNDRSDMQFFEHDNILYAVEQIIETKSQKTKYLLYRFNENGEEILFSEYINSHMFYQTGSPTGYNWKTQAYSNVLFDGNKLSFWANDSLSRISGSSLRLFTIDVKGKTVVSKSIRDENMINGFQYLYPPYSLQLVRKNAQVVTTTNVDDYFSFALNEGKNTFEKTEIPFQKSLTKITDSLYLNFSYPNEVIVQDYYSNVKLKEKLNTYYTVGNDFYFYYNDGNRLVIPSMMKDEVVIFDGYTTKNVSTTMNDFDKLLLNNFTQTKIGNKHVIFRHGLKMDGTTGGKYYVFDDIDFSTKELYSYSSDYFSFGYLDQQSNNNSYTLILNPDKETIITNFKDFYSLKNRNGKSYNSILHRFQNKSFLIYQNDGSIVYYNLEGHVIKDIYPNYLYQDFRSSNYFFFMDENSFKVVDSQGRVSVIADARDYPNPTKVSNSEVIFNKDNEIVIIDINTRRESSFRTKVRLYNYFKVGGSYFGFSADNKLHQINFERKTINKLINNPLIPYLSDINSVVYLRDEYMVKEELSMWKLNEKGLNKVFNIEETSFLNEPSLPMIVQLKGYNLWLPETEEFIALNSSKLNFYVNFEYILSKNNIIYFRAVSTEKGSNVIFSLNKLNFEVKELWSYQSYYVNTKVFNEDMYIATERELFMINLNELNVELVGNFPYFSVSGQNPFLEFKNNLYFWAYDKNHKGQLWQLTDNETKEDILLTTENPNINFSFYPNPTQDFLNVSSTAETENKYKITIISSEGKVVSEQSLELPQKLDLSGLKTGVYLINVRAGKENKTFRVMKQ